MANVRKESLISEVTTRESEILFYQINIDKYSRIIAKLKDAPDPEMVEYKKHMKELLHTEKTEQSKVKITLEVVREMLREEPND
jgi:hypothetical protein